MNVAAANLTPEPPPAVAQPVSFIRRWIGDRGELVFFALLLLIVNAPTLVGSNWQALMFHPAAVQAGQWWRIFTHPFVHVTWYHLLLDGAAFLSLYHSLVEPSRRKRLLLVFAAGAGSLLLAWLGAPMIRVVGFCGLSGIAHGLMTISAVEMMKNRAPDSTEWRIGAITFGIVVVKAAYEAISGKILFAFLYLGLIGDPVTVSHAGGIVGGLLAWLVCNGTLAARLRRFGPPNPACREK